MTQDPNIFNRPHPTLEPHRVGEPLSGRKLNAQTAAIEELYSRVRTPRQILPSRSKGGGGTAEAFRLGRVIEKASEQFLKMQLLTRDENGDFVDATREEEPPGGGDPIQVPDVQVIEVWPGWTGDDYTRFTDTDMLKIERFSGEWFVRWHARMTVASPNQPSGGCI